LEREEISIPTEQRSSVALDLMVIGAAKSGTSSLVRLLHAAPRVAGNPTGAEIGYFSSDDEFARGAASARRKYFDSDSADLLRIGKSAGLVYSRQALERLAADSPGLRAAVLIREPVARAHSAYAWAQRAGYETESFADAVRRELDGRDLDLPRPELRAYIGRGEYARHLEEAFEILGRDRVDVLTFDEFTADPIACANRLLTHFDRSITDVPPAETHVNRSRAVRSQRMARLVRSRRLRAPLRRVLPTRAKAALARTAHRLNDKPAEQRAAMDAETRELLVAHFRPWNERLDALLGRPTGWG
jgi:hypothetical protein